MSKLLIVAAILALFVLAVLAAAYVDAFLLEPNWLKTEYVAITAPRLARAVGQLTIAQISDTHFRGSGGFLEREIIKAVRKERPDVIFITGDFISRRLALERFWDFVSQLRPSVWIYGVPGDEDEALISDRWKDEGWRKAGMALLADEILPVVWPRAGGGRVWIVAAASDFNWPENLKEVPPGDPLIVLVHRPAGVKDAAIAGADLVLAGDTHGAQLGIAVLRRFSAYAERGPYTAGLYRVKDTLMYVNRGIGWKARPMRFFCRPELTVFRFEAEGPAERARVLPGDE